MKLTFEPAPHYRSSQSTSGIMKDLTLCLCAITIFAIAYYSFAFGASYGLRIVFMMVAAIASACIAEAVFFKMTKQDIKDGILNSYPWVTAMILVLISSVDNSIYAIAISTFLAIVFGKLVFGGFGQNIFNPAALGEAILMSSFASSKVADFTTGATPTTAINSYGWIATAENSASLLEQFGGFGKMFLGLYPSTIGSTCAILIIIACVFLVVRKDIDWQAPVCYIGTIFVLSAIIAVIKGTGMWYPLFQVLAGGVLFGGVFMLTDPVTSPITIPGRMLYAVGAAALTLIFRFRSNMADGVLYSILLMNMLAPAIDKLMEGNQIKDAGKITRNLIIGCVAFVAVTLGVGAIAEFKEPNASNGGSDTEVAAGVGLASDFSENEATCEQTSSSGSTAVYACTAKGFGLLMDMDGYSRNEATITVDLDNNSIVSIELTKFGDTEGIGDLATTEDALAAYAGLTLNDSVDSVTGATFTSKSVAAMAAEALSYTGSAGYSFTDDYADNKATVEEVSNDGTTAVYHTTAQGFQGVNEADITINVADGTIVSIEVTTFNDTPGIGDNATTDDVLAAYVGKGLNDSADLVSGATFTNKSIVAMASAALNAAAGN